jgi:isopropylmalate/homocitrate/citramalate synthase
MASTIAAIHAGADIAEVSVNGICSAAGQCDLAELAAALEVIYGVRTGIVLERLTALSRLVQDITGIRMAPNKAITGTEAWTYTEEAMREESAYAPIHKAAEPEIFGNDAHYVLGPHSGTWSVRGKLNDVGLAVDDEVVPQILADVKREMRARGRGLTDDEVADIACRYGATPKV